MDTPPPPKTPRWADEPDDAPMPPVPDYGQGPKKYMPPQTRPVVRRPREKEKDLK